ncbi:MAG TPA: histidinol dehydrogenase, partial [Hyphomonas sp.]|nr:histidinol dehydrogenase [Hyphomonas sp.]
MVRRFFASNDAFNGEFAQFLEQERGTGEDVANTVTGILKDVQARGGEAVAEYTARFDGLQLDPSTLTSDNVNLHSLAAQCPADLREAIDFAHDRIATYHAAQRPADHSFTDSAGVELGWRWTALESVGVYVPGGRASYPSSVLMNVVPAKIAGVERIVMVAPAPQGELSPAVAYAALKAGVEEFYPIGGAQAVGALAFGTSNMAPVDKIVGPGNAFVAEA